MGADPFNQIKDKAFIDQLKRRLWMLAFPEELIPLADSIVIRAKESDNDCCGHYNAELFVGNTVPDGIDGTTFVNWDMHDLINEFFGTEVDEDA